MVIDLGPVSAGFVAPDLKECPFCGAGILRFTEHPSFFHPGALGDKGCVLAGRGFRDDEAQSWNTRAAALEKRPFAFFQWNEGWHVWEQVIDEAQNRPGVIAAYRRAPAQADTRRMAETGTGSGRSPSGTVGEADAPKHSQDTQ